MSTPREDYLTRKAYIGADIALMDALHVLQDLQDLADGQLLVPSAELVFLARRARQLVRACYDLEVSP